MTTKFLKFAAAAMLFLTAACASSNTPDPELDMSKTIAEGTNSDFSHTVTTDASQEAIWYLWTTAETWESWDGGLKSASIEGEFTEGAKGKLIDLSNRTSKFKITEIDGKTGYSFATTLPLAKLTVTRYFEPSSHGKTVFTHRVRFTGLLGGLFARMLAPEFRAELPDTMERLADLAEARES